MNRNDLVPNNQEDLIPTSQSGLFFVGASRLDAFGSVAARF
jgi:hypothetical protein